MYRPCTECVPGQTSMGGPCVSRPPPSHAHDLREGKSRWSESRPSLALQAGGRRFESARLHQTQVGGRLAGSQQRQIGDEQAQRVDVRTSPEMDR
jgi:hypothetical protein